LLTIGILSGQFGQTKLGVLIGLERDLGINYLVCICYYLHTRISKVGPVNDQRLLLLSVLLLFGSVI
jgi:hypothetical protein